MSFLTNFVWIEYRSIFKPSVNAQVIYSDINAQVIFRSELCNAWLYAQGFIPAPFEWSIDHFLIPDFNAQACLVLHTGLFYLLILNRARHFSYPGFNAHGFWYVIPGVLLRSYFLGVLLKSNYLGVLHRSFLNNS